MAVAVVGSLLKGLVSSHNNYLIFKGSFIHTINELPLFAQYPAEYADVNHYGPFFGFFMAPFALLPNVLGILFLMVACTVALYYAIKLLPLQQWQHAVIYWFCLNELFTAVAMQQLNILIAAIIILAYALINRKKDFWAAFFIILGIFIKIYGIVGLAFFFFSKRKGVFIGSLVFWSVIMFVAPMLISSYDYVISQYAAWFEELLTKNTLNYFASHQNISLLGMVRKISGSPFYSDLLVIIPGLVLYALAYTRIKEYNNKTYQMMLLASTLLFTVLFSTGSESSSYIIALPGVALWYVITPTGRGVLNTSLLIFAFVLTSLSPTDIIPRFIRTEYVLPYALKALPCALVWFKIVYEMATKRFTTFS